jgi:hypothetical protein
MRSSRNGSAGLRRTCARDDLATAIRRERRLTIRFAKFSQTRFFLKPPIRHRKTSIYRFLLLLYSQDQASDRRSGRLRDD